MSANYKDVILLVCIKKRRNEAGVTIQQELEAPESGNDSDEFQPELPHKPVSNFIIPMILEDTELAFMNWFNHIRTTLPSTEFKHLLNLNYINENDDHYNHQLVPHKHVCRQSKSLNDQLNQTLFNSIEASLFKTLNLSANQLSYYNFESIKRYFQSKINVFYLMNLEVNLAFVHKFQFIKDLDYISNIYHLIFNTTPDSELKSNWVLNALNKNPSENHPLILQIHDNWAVINKDPLIVRRIIMSHTKPSVAT